MLNTPSDYVRAKVRIQHDDGSPDVVTPWQDFLEANEHDDEILIALLMAESRGRQPIGGGAAPLAFLSIEIGLP